MYYEIFKGVITSIATSTIATAVKGAIERYFGQGSKTQPTSEETQYPIMSIPLAIGYYYNFIDKIEDGLRGGNFTVQKHYTLQGGGVLDKLVLNDQQKSQITSDELKQLSFATIEKTESLGKFDPSAISVELIYPKNLSNQTMQSCSDFLRKKTNQGSIPSAVAGRRYGINYKDISPAGPSEIRIVDYTRPVEVIPRYYRDIKHVGGMGSDPEVWKRIEDREMQAFLFALKYMIETTSVFLSDKVYFRPSDSLSEGTAAS